ncbi:MAG: histidinol-phosphatase HisJ family protein [Gemmatimonadota bacterium]
MINAHFHDEHSSDAFDPLAAHVEAAGKDVTYVCVTNHAEALLPDGTWAADPEEMIPRFRRSAESVRAAADRWPDRAIRLGVELEYRPEWLGAFETLLAAVPFDLVLGSVHVVDGMNISGGPDVDAFFNERPQDEAYEKYFAEVEDLVAWGGFDVVAHFDLVKRYGHRHYGAYDPERYRGRIETILARMARDGIGLEINTSGVGQAPGVPYPEPEVLRWALDLDVEHLTIGSDSHRPETFLRGLDTGFGLARRTGWESFALFENRRPAGRVELSVAI